MRIDVSALRDSEEFLNFVCDNVTSAIFLADADTRIYSFNNCFQTLFYKPEDQIIKELCGNAMGCAFAVDEQKDCGKTSNCDSCLLRHNIISSLTEQVPIFKAHLDREFIINQQRLQKHFTFSTRYVYYNNQAMILIIVEDITEIEASRRRIADQNSALQQIIQEKIQEIYKESRHIVTIDGFSEQLIEEIHHRVGNNLQMILALIRLHSTGSDHKATSCQSLENRVLAISYLYQFLIPAGIVFFVDMAKYLTYLTRKVGSSLAVEKQGLQINLTCQELFLNIDQALAIGLIVNETLDNALRHGFDNRPSGTVTIALANTSTGIMTLKIDDDGNGMPDAKENRFGLRIVRELCQNLHADLLVTTRNGCHYKIIIDQADQALRAPGV